MKTLRMTLLAMAALLMTLPMQAQQPNKLPIDSAVRVGQLPNGLTYYIRHNEEPKDRCDFHIAQAVGAVLEEDNQNGLAHFLEHMAFNGTQHFPGKGIINYFESVGVNFGGNINAYTSIDETVYRLSDVPTIREGIVDSALLVMHDWSCGLLLLGEEIDAERGVIREEWRTGRTAQRRLWRESRALMFPNSQYGKRDVIGDTAVINNFEYEALRAYYKKWYGPDNQAIIVVGDINVDDIEAKIKALWADVPERVNRGERPLYTVEDNSEPIVAIVTDKEAQSTRIQLYWKHHQLPAEYQGTDVEYMIDVCRNLIGDMMDERFTEESMKPECSYLGGGAGYYELVKLRDAFTGVVVAKEGRETEAYQDLLYQLEKMRRYGFTSDELERAKTETLSQYERNYNNRNKRNNQSLAREYIRHFEDGEAIPGIEFEYEFMQQILPIISIEMINKMAEEQMITDENCIICITGVDKEGVNIPTHEQALTMLANMKNLEIEAPKENNISKPLVSKTPKAGKIKKQTTDPTLGTTTWILSNGVKVVIKPTDFKDDQILMEAFSEGGTGTLEVADLPSAEMATSIVAYGGLGEFSLTELQKVLTGKQASVSPSISENMESMEGSSSVKDFETMLQLTYLYFTSPRRDENAFKTLMGLMEQQLKNKDKDPKRAFRDSVNMLSSNYSPRTMLFNQEFIDQVDLDKAIKIYKERFANPKDFTFVFVGNIDPNSPATREAICRWIGGLKCKGKMEKAQDRGVRAPKGENKLYFSREMTTTTATNRVQYTSYKMKNDLQTRLNLNMVGRVLSTRYLESVREREGGSYGVGVYGSMTQLPVPEAYLIIQWDTDPAKQVRIMEIVHEEIDTIISNGPLANDLSKEKASMLKDFEENLRDNSWWQNAIIRYLHYGENLVTDYKNAVEALSAESVQQTLKQIVEENNVIEVVMMPE